MTRNQFQNLSLAIVSVLMISSGVVIQLYYHVGRLSSAVDVWSVRYDQWSVIHKWSALVFLLLIIQHIVIHLKWYKVILQKRLFRKNRNVLILTFLTLFVSITGFIPWAIHFFQGDDSIRHLLIEIHDKTAILFMVFIVQHFLKRMKRMSVSNKK